MKLIHIASINLISPELSFNASEKNYPLKKFVKIFL